LSPFAYHHHHHHHHHEREREGERGNVINNIIIMLPGKDKPMSTLHVVSLHHPSSQHCELRAAMVVWVTRRLCLKGDAHHHMQSPVERHLSRDHIDLRP